MNYLLHLFIYFCVYATIGIGLNVVVGYCGLLTLAQAAFFAIGCYSYALGSLVFHWGLFGTLLCSTVLAVLFSLFVSVPAWRLRGDFFVMTTLAVQALLVSVLNNWSQVGRPIGSLENLTNGPSGLPGIPTPVVFNIQIDTKSGFAVVSGAVLGFYYLTSRLLLKAPWGRTLLALKDDELASRGLGKNVRVLKVQAFAISSVISASAGIIYAAYVGYIDPTVASLDNSILMISMLIIGGVGTLAGPLLGAALLIGIPEVLRFVSVPDSMVGSIRLLAFGLLQLILMHVRPQGLLGRMHWEES
jgi:branched-chain amino acid transport system permease protein